MRVVKNVSQIAKSYFMTNRPTLGRKNLALLPHHSAPFAEAVGTWNPISQNKNTATQPNMTHTKGRATANALIAITA